MLAWFYYLLFSSHTLPQPNKKNTIIKLFYFFSGGLRSFKVFINENKNGRLISSEKNKYRSFYEAVKECRDYDRSYNECHNELYIKAKVRLIKSGYKNPEEGAKDICQEVFIKVIKNYANKERIGEIDKVKSALGLFLSILRTTSLDFIRHNGLKIDYVERDFEDLYDVEEESDIRFGTVEDLREAEQEAKIKCKGCRDKFLSKAQSRAMDYLTEGYDKNEVAEILGVANKTITNLYSQSRGSIRANCKQFCGKNIRNEKK